MFCFGVPCYSLTAVFFSLSRMGQQLIGRDNVFPHRSDTCVDSEWSWSSSVHHPLCSSGSCHHCKGHEKVRYRFQSNLLSISKHRLHGRSQGQQTPTPIWNIYWSWAQQGRKCHFRRQATSGRAGETEENGTEDIYEDTAPNNLSSSVSNQAMPPAHQYNTQINLTALPHNATNSTNINQISNINIQNSEGQTNFGDTHISHDYATLANDQGSDGYFEPVGTERSEGHQRSERESENSSIFPEPYQPARSHPHFGETENDSISLAPSYAEAYQFGPHRRIQQINE